MLFLNHLNFTPDRPTYLNGRIEVEEKMFVKKRYYTESI
jgi:hypothetical protein